MIERHSRTTIYTTKTVIVKKKFIEEQMVNDQWVTTDEYQVNQISHISIIYVGIYICHVCILLYWQSQSFSTFILGIFFGDTNYATI